jgi:hypothetical protein
MNFKSLLSCVALLTLAGCAGYPPPGPLVYGRCGMDAHTEAYPLAEQDRRAYGCKRDQDGFLETGAQADPHGN